MICQREFGVWPFIFYGFDPDREETPDEYIIILILRQYSLTGKYFRLDFCIEQGIAQEPLKNHFKLDKVLEKIQSYIKTSCSKLLNILKTKFLLKKYLYYKQIYLN
jgi:hypothetical protein